MEAGKDQNLQILNFYWIPCISGLIIVLLIGDVCMSVTTEQGCRQTALTWSKAWHGSPRLNKCFTQKVILNSQSSGQPSAWTAELSLASFEKDLFACSHSVTMLSKLGLPLEHGQSGNQTVLIWGVCFFVVCFLCSVTIPQVLLRHWPRVCSLLTVAPLPLIPQNYSRNMCPVSWCDRWLPFLCVHPISSRQLLSKMSVWCQRHLKTIQGSRLAAFLNLLLLFWAF